MLTKIVVSTPMAGTSLRQQAPIVPDGAILLVSGNSRPGRSGYCLNLRIHAPEFQGRYTAAFLEQPGERAAITKATGKDNISNGNLRADQEFLGCTQAAFGKVLIRCQTKFMFELSQEMSAGHKGCGSHVCQTDVAIVIVLDEITRTSQASNNIRALGTLAHYSCVCHLDLHSSTNERNFTYDE